MNQINDWSLIIHLISRISDSNWYIRNNWKIAWLSSASNESASVSIVQKKSILL